MDESYTLKIIDINVTIQLNLVIEEYLKLNELNEECIELIKSTNDSKINYNYLKFFASFDNLNLFIKYYQENYPNPFIYEILHSELELDMQLPGHLFIRGFSNSTTKKMLCDIFAPFGNILECKIVKDEYGVSKCFGFINFDNKNSANKAITSLDGSLLNGNKLFINHHISKKDRLKTLESKMSNYSGIYVSNLPSTTTKEDLKILFSKFGPIESITLPHKDSDTNFNKTDVNSSTDIFESKGYGFVNFKYHQDAKNALKKMDNFQIKTGDRIQVKKAGLRREREQYHILNNHFTKPKSNIKLLKQIPINSQHSTTFGLFPIPGPMQQPSNLYVCQLPLNFGDIELRKIFAPFGEIISCKVIRWQPDETGSNGRIGFSKQFGFVSFRSTYDASRALIGLDGYRIDHHHTLKVSFAQRKDNEGIVQPRRENWGIYYYPYMLPRYQ
ncbi:Rie1 protein [Martiniozyma asiatica (nom. inval.)]|nr:Rie1 protein [Martiniozyma asiatica]